MPLFPTDMRSERLRYERLHRVEFDPWELYEHGRSDAPNIEEITRHVRWEPYGTPEEAFEWVERCSEAFDAGEDATYVLRPRDGEYAEELAGLSNIEVDWDRRTGTMGIWLRKSMWGQGYSGERAARFFELAFDRLDLDVVVAKHDPANDNSRRAISAYVERFGGTKEGRIRNALVVDGEPRDAVRYSVTREEWERNRE